ncbi:hypothetical protein B0O99DRAFT_390243 [Bisporella sp. PMI_857]|nr:hypothetical protein B0O99DRAFT_390243 [Bisporella sp. PMI_857]
MVPSSDDEDDEENEPHNDDEHDDDFDSGSTVVVDESSNSGDFASYLHMTRQLLKYPTKLKKLQLEVLELQTLNKNLENSNMDLKMKIEDTHRSMRETKKQHKSANLNTEVLLEKLEEKQLEVKEMKTICGGLEQKDKETTRKYAALEQQNKEMRTKCDRLERENEELNRKYAASEQKREEVEAAANIAIHKAMIVSDECDALIAEFKQHNESNRALIMGVPVSIERSHSSVFETTTRPTETPGQAWHQESPRKTHARPSNTPAALKISQYPHLGHAARNRPFKPSLSQQSPTRPIRPIRPALMPKPNNANVLTFNSHSPSHNGREGTGTSAKNTPTAQGSENIAQGDTEQLQTQTESPDCRIFRISLADDHGGQMFSFKRECSDDERAQTSSKRARN